MLDNFNRATGRSQHGADDVGQVANGLAHRSFVGLAILFFCTSFNDNAYRWLVIPIGDYLLGPGYEGLLLSVGLACFVLPYTLLPGPAGYLADRFSKRSVMSGCMIAQTAIILFGLWAILTSDAFLIFCADFDGGSRRLLAPAKSGCVPEIVPLQSISAANGVLGMATILSAVAGSVIGEELYVLTRPAGIHHCWMSAIVLVGVSVAGWLGSLAVVHCPAADPQRPVPWNVARETIHDLALLASDRRLMLVAFASAFFWLLAAISQINVYLFGTTELHLGDEYIGPLLGVLAIGAGIGAVLAGVWSAGRIDLGIVPLSALGMAVSAAALFFVPRLSAAPSWTHLRTCAALGLLGITAGLYDVPLQSYLQYFSPVENRGGLLAAANLLSFSAMLLASGIFWVLRDALGVSAGGIFLFGGGAALAVAVALQWSEPGEAAGAARLFRRLTRRFRPSSH